MKRGSRLPCWEETVTDIVTLKKDSKRIAHLGLRLAEAKQLLNTIQKHEPQSIKGAYDAV
jgi:hypothetical protein